MLHRRTWNSSPISFSTLATLTTTAPPYWYIRTVYAISRLRWNAIVIQLACESHCTRHIIRASSFCCIATCVCLLWVCVWTALNASCTLWSSLGNPHLNHRLPCWTHLSLKSLMTIMTKNTLIIIIVYAMLHSCFVCTRSSLHLLRSANRILYLETKNAFDVRHIKKVPFIRTCIHHPSVHSLFIFIKKWLIIIITLVSFPQYTISRRWKEEEEKTWRRMNSFPRPFSDVNILWRISLRSQLFKRKKCDFFLRWRVEI